MLGCVENGLNVLSMFSNVYITILSNIKYSNISIELGLGWNRGKGVSEGVRNRHSEKKSK